MELGQKQWSLDGISEIIIFISEDRPELQELVQE